MNRSQIKSLLILILGSFFIGFAPIFVRLSEIGPVATGFWRMFLSLIPLYIISKFLGYPNNNRPRLNKILGDLWIFIGVGFFFAGDLGSWHIALHHTSVTNSLIIVNSTIFVVAIGARIFYKELISKYLIAGALIAFTGVTFLILGSASKIVVVHQETLYGDLLSCVTNLFYAAYLLQLRYASQKYPVIIILFISYFFCGLFLLILALILGEQIIPETLYGWTIVAALALVCQIGGQSLIAKEIKNLPVSFTSMVLLSQVLVGAFASAIILSEPITIIQIAGAALLAFGIYWARPR